MQRFEASAEGSHARIAPGEEFALALAENPTTGFRWALVDLPPFLSITHEDFSPPDGREAGAGGVRRWRLRVNSPGHGTLHAELRARTPRQATPRSFTLDIEAPPG
jgi:predicted secreted protein